MGKSWLRGFGRATRLWGDGNSALSYMSGNVDWRRNRDMSNTAYQRAAADKAAAGINPLFDGAAASPSAVSNTESGSGEALGKVLSLSFGMLNTALSAVKTFADADAARSGAEFNRSHSAYVAEQTVDLITTRPGRLADIASRVGLTKAQTEVALESLNEIAARINDLQASTEQKKKLTQEVDKRIEKLTHEISSAKSKAEVDSIVATFQKGIGGDIQRWTDAVGLKGRDIVQLVSVFGVLAKVLGNGGSKRPFGFDTGGLR